MKSSKNNIDLAIFGGEFIDKKALISDDVI